MKLSRRQAIFGLAATGAGLGALTYPQLRPTLATASRPATAFGTTVRLTISAATPAAAEACVEAGYGAIREVEKACNLFDPQSELSRLNREGALANPSPVLYGVLAAAAKVHRITQGAFDPTVQKLWEAWAPTLQHGAPPSDDRLAALLPAIGFNHVALAPSRITRLTAATLTLNGIARGYAADHVAKAIGPLGAVSAVLDTDEIGLLGEQGDLTFAIDHPRQPGTAIGRLKAAHGFISTSGDYNSSFTPDFRDNHIFDPSTGRSPPELASATVIAPSGAEADALSTAFMVMGAEKSAAFLRQRPHYGALLIAKDMIVHNHLGALASFAAAG